MLNPHGAVVETYYFIKLTYKSLTLIAQKVQGKYLLFWNKDGLQKNILSLYVRVATIRKYYHFSIYRPTLWL